MSDLKLRPIGESDYSVIREGRDIGRMAAWSRGSADTLDAAKDAFRTAWERFYSSLTPEQIARWHHTQDARKP